MFMHSASNSHPALALLTAARRYLIARQAEVGDDHDARRLLADMLVEVERTDPAHLPDLEQMRDRFVSVRLQPGGTDERRRAADREFGGFRVFIAGLDAAALARVEPMPARRVLSADEVALVNSKVLAELGFNRSYYFPLAPMPPRPAPVDAYLSRWFERAFDGDTVRRLLRDRRIARTWMLSEFSADPDYEMEVDLVDPGFSGEEVFYTSPELDWLLYESHEGSVTVAGWLATRVRELQPDAEAHRWSLKAAYPE